MSLFVRRTFPYLLATAALVLLAGCGGPAMAAPTAIPASVVRPVQPTPVYPTSAAVYALLTPGVTPQFVDDSLAGNAEVPAAGGERAAIALYMQEQTPSALGIAPGGATIYAERGGRALATVPPAGVLTITGKSADGAWYAVYNDAAVYGWTPAGQLRVYGDEDLVVVQEAPDPGPIATLLAQAAEPVAVLDDLLAQFDVTATAMAQQPTPTTAAIALTEAAPTEAAPTAVSTAVTPMPAGLLATPTPAPAAAPSAETAALEQEPAQAAQTGVVSSDGRLNLRAEPDTAAAIVRKLDPGEVVSILESDAENAWLRVQLADGATGWVAAEFVALE
jgi:uncharacterized protein with GYD domain